MTDRQTHTYTHFPLVSNGSHRQACRHFCIWNWATYATNWSPSSLPISRDTHSISLRKACIVIAPWWPRDLKMTGPNHTRTHRMPRSMTGSIITAMLLLCMASLQLTAGSSSSKNSALDLVAAKSNSTSSVSLTRQESLALGSWPWLSPLRLENWTAAEGRQAGGQGTGGLSSWLRTMVIQRLMSVLMTFADSIDSTAAVSYSLRVRKWYISCKERVKNIGILIR